MGGRSAAPSTQLSWCRCDRKKHTHTQQNRYGDFCPPNPTPSDEEGAELDGKKKVRLMGELLTTTGEDSGGGTG